jgi:iron(III) transport system permease protein
MQMALTQGRFRFSRARSAPWYLLAPALLVAGAVLLPVFYLVLRALDADAALLGDILLRPRNLRMFMNTLTLTGGVLICTSAIALPLAWLTTRSRLPGRILITILGTLPLAVPGYVMAYALIGLGGDYGLLNNLFAVRAPRIEGYWGALIALSLYTFPYLFLNLRSALAGIDARQEETARSMGLGAWQTFFSVALPQLRPALLAGWLVIGLYVLGDFGTVTLMRFEVFSTAIYTQYTGAFDRVYTAWLALMLLSLAGCFIAAEHYALGRRRFAPTSSGAARKARFTPLKRWQNGLTLAFLIVVFGASLGLPLVTLGYWLSLMPAGFDVAPALRALLHSLSAAAPAALLAALCALPVVYLRVRHPGKMTHLLERVTLLGYAVPPLALALAFVFFALGAAPWLYQTLVLLVIAYAVNFAALAMGPLRAAILQISPRHAETARALGKSSFQAFTHVTLPVLQRGFLAAFIMVFLMVMKELPIAFLLAPTGFSTLAVSMFSRTNEGLLVDAAPYAAGIIVFSGIFIAILLYTMRRDIAYEETDQGQSG